MIESVLKIKLPAGKRTIFVQDQKYFLELPELKFNIKYRCYSLNEWCPGPKRLKSYYVTLYVKPNLLLANIAGGRVCLNKPSFAKKDFPKNVLNKFFCSRFGKYFMENDINHYFYSQWEKYGLKYHDFMGRQRLPIDMIEYKEIEKRFFKNEQ